MSTPRPYVDLDPLAAITAERQYQDEKWGGSPHDRDHPFSEWALILSREVGEAMEALGRCHWPQDRDPDVSYGDKLLDLRSELVQVAAVAVAIIEVVDRTEYVDLTGPRADPGPVPMRAVRNASGVGPEVTRFRRAIAELIAMVVPATGVDVTPESRRASQEGLLAYLNLTEEDLRG